MEIEKLIDILEKFQTEGIEYVHLLRKPSDDICFFPENISGYSLDFGNKSIILYSEYI